MILLRQFLKLPPKKSLAADFVRRPCPRENGPFCNRQVGIRNHEIRIHLKLLTQPLAGRTSAKRRIKGKKAGFNFRQTNPANLAREMLRKYRILSGL